MYSFHKQDKIFASDLYGPLQWLAYRLAIVKAHTDLPLIFYLLLNHQYVVEFRVSLEHKQSELELKES